MLILDDLWQFKRGLLEFNVFLQKLGILQFFFCFKIKDIYVYGKGEGWLRFSDLWSDQNPDETDI